MPERLRTGLHSRRGETLVEVLVAFALLALFLAVWATAQLAAGDFQRRADARSETFETLTEPLRGTGYAGAGAEPNGTAHYEFYTGSGEPAFAVEAPRETVTTSAGGETHTFRRFTAPEPAGAAP